MKARLSESVSGLSLTSSRQEKVAVALVQHVLDGLRDQVEGPRGIVELDLPALDAGKPGFQRAGQAADRGIAGHDLDQGRGGFELAGDLGRPPRRAGTTARSSRRTRRIRAAAPIRNSWCRRSSFSASALAAALVEFRRRRLHHGEDQLAPGRTPCSNWLSRLRQSRFWRNQRVDVGVDGEIAGGVEARRDRKQRARGRRREGKPRASLNNRDNNTCQHIFSF